MSGDQESKPIGITEHGDLVYRYDPDPSSAPINLKHHGTKITSKVVGITLFQERVIVATEQGVFELVYGELKAIPLTYTEVSEVPHNIWGEPIYPLEVEEEGDDKIVFRPFVDRPKEPNP